MKAIRERSLKHEISNISTPREDSSTLSKPQPRRELRADRCAKPIGQREVRGWVRGGPAEIRG